MGLLDGLLGSSFDDPKTAATLQLAQGLLGSPNLMQGATSGLQGYQQAIQMAKQKALEQQMETARVQTAQMQVAQQQAEQRRQQAMQALLPQFNQTPQQQALAAGGAGPTNTALAASKTMPGGFDFQGYAKALAGIDPMASIQMQAAIKKEATPPIKVDAGGALWDPVTQKQVFSNPKEQTPPSAVQEYQFAKAQGYQGTLQQFLIEQKKAGASSVSVSMDKGFGDAFAKDAATALATSRDQAKAAAASIQALDRASQAVSTGNVVTGPGAGVKTTLLQIGQALGANGKDDTEKLMNTRSLLQAGAALAVQGSNALKGQGAITEEERKLINKMASGDLESMTLPEIKASIAAQKKIQLATINAHNSSLQNVGAQFKAFTPFYQVVVPQSPAGTGDGWAITPR